MVENFGQSTTVLLVFAILSGVLSTFAFAPYAADTIARRTQPQRASWFIWSVLSTISFFSQVHEGASSTLWFAGVQVTGTLCIFLLSIAYGKGSLLNRRDSVVLLSALSGLVIWYYTETAVYSLAISITISLLGGSVTVLKAYREPESETFSTWFLGFIASVCAILSVGTLDWIILAYPLYLLALNGAIVVAMTLGRMRGAEPIPDFNTGANPSRA